MAHLLDARQTTEHYADEDDRVLLDDTLSGISSRGLPPAELPGFEPCGPRRKIYFDPSKTRAAIVTCGGLCPGLNDVIAGLVRCLTYHYRARRVVGIRSGCTSTCCLWSEGTVRCAGRCRSRAPWPSAAC